MFERNYRLFNDGEFRNDLKDIPWDNGLSLDDIYAILAFDWCSAIVNKLLDEHAPNHKLSKKEISMKDKLWKKTNNLSLRMRQAI